LLSLQQDLREHGSDLLIVQGQAAHWLPKLIKTLHADAVVWNRRYAAHQIAEDTTIKQQLREQGIEVKSFNASLLNEPWDIKTQQGECYKVFTPFWKSCLQRGINSNSLPIPSLSSTLSPTLKQAMNSASQPLDALHLLPTQPDWAAGLREKWQVSEQAAQQRLHRFCESTLTRYAEACDFPAQAVTSELSAYLQWGQISPRQIYQHSAAVTDPNSYALQRFHAELGWREFSYHLLFHFPSLPNQAFKTNFNGFAWQTDPAELRAWQRGLTGYPLVDAGMRQLWHTGIMHNRVRMVVASFLTKHLRIAWQAGEAWFWDTLVDADLASNAASWQWVAGCGADAAPYFRIFNPIMQSEKFDGEGVYLRTWLPELDALPAKLIHTPWLLTPIQMQQYGVMIGRDYPKPIVDHSEARDAALSAYAVIKQT
jgi:deoxyribodipyrimidine photo-lyase